MSGVILLALRLILVIILYVFLGWVLISLWRDLRYQREMLAAKQAPSIGLRAEHQDAIHTFQFKKSVVVIGRDPNCECTLPSEKVSANHARLSFHQNQWWIEDLNSTNGSFLNDEPVLKPAVVVNGDLLRCGNVMLTIQLEAA